MRGARAAVWRSCGSLLLSGALSVAAAAAHAQRSDATYEAERAARALRERSLQPDPAPEGKRIEFIEVVREEVLQNDELLVPVVLPRFAPTWPNAFHWLTRESVIRRELLFQQGEPYRADRVEESMRNLRALGIFALVRIVAVRAGEPDQVGVLVYTRDLWSLRPETGFSGAGSAFQLTGQLVQRNFLGRNKDLTLRFDIDPKAYSLGEAYDDARVLGGELALSESFDLIFNRESGKTEGSQGALWLTRPFRKLSQAWQWGLSASYAAYVARALRGSEIVSFRPKASGGLEECQAPDPACMRAVWDQHSYSASASASYRRGEAYKQTFTLGAGFGEIQVAANRETALRPEQSAIFESELLPKARRQVYPYVSYDLWLPDYVTFHDLGTFGQTETVRVGPRATSSVSVPLKAFGSSSSSAVFSSTLDYVLAGGGALAEGSATGSTRLESSRVVDQSLSLLVRGATPLWLAGRLVAYASWSGRRHDTAQSQVTLGADNGLRGYQVGAFRVVGGNRLRANLEYRTLPLVFESVHIGAVAFYDAGSVYGALADARLHHDLGVGLRVLFPQFNHTPFRADFGLPLDRNGFALLVSYGSDQAVPMTAADDASGSTGVRPR